MIPKRKLFLLILAPTAVALLLGLALLQDKSLGVSQEGFEKLLLTSWRLAKLSYELGMTREPEAQRMAETMTRDIGFRITLIDENGRVSFDSEVPGELESHRDRPEFKAALTGHPIFATRRSDTVGRETMYYAQKVDEGVILRVSSPLEYFDAQRTLFFRQAGLAALALVFGVFLFSLWASRRQARVFRELSLAVGAAKNGAQELPTFKSQELDEALFALSQAARDLKARNQEIVGLNTRLEYILSKINEGVIFLDGTRIIYRNKRAEEILGCQIPESTTQIAKNEILSIFALVKNPQFNHLKIGERVIFFDQAREDERLLVIFHDQTEKEKYSNYKSDLVGNVSHELKTPLALVLGAAEVILRDREMSRPFLEKFLNTLYRNAQRLNNLLDDLILLHQLESRPESLSEECDLKEIVGEIEEMIDPGDKVVEWDYDQVKVNFHSAHLISVLTNLINNALKYSKGPKIQVEVRHRESYLEIAVADGGPMIPVSERERIFERFYSMSRSRNRERSGSGLGLAIVKHIARLYRGQVKVSENDQGGNTFWVMMTAPKEF
ncbi:MAG: GHKL domain-containing protein [Deltaproteobacteria bacterium]|nr:GHKL domain-containing protein [Deltaproteobacteria bacterium]